MKKKIMAKNQKQNKLYKDLNNTMKNPKIEYRIQGSISSEVKSRKIHGLAISVETKSELLGGQFYETIAKSAINNDLIANNDIKLYMNHDSSQGTLARSKYGKGSLQLRITDKGLEFETELPDTEKGNEVIEGIRRGDIDACSFAMIPDSVTWEENEDGTYSRTINSFKMVDEISILSCLPAYPATSVDMRSLDDFKAFETRAEEDEKEEEAKEDEKEEDNIQESEETSQETEDNTSEETNDDEEEKSLDENPDDKKEEDEDEEGLEEERDWHKYYEELRSLIQ